MRHSRQVFRTDHHQIAGLELHVVHDFACLQLHPHGVVGLGFGGVGWLTSFRPGCQMGNVKDRCLDNNQKKTFVTVGQTYLQTGS